MMSLISCVCRQQVTIHNINPNSPVRYVFSFRIFGDLKNYTFLETLGSTESEKQCLRFFKHPMAAILDFQNGDYFFLKFGNISASNHPRHMILVSTHTFSRSRNPVGQLIRC